MKALRLFPAISFRLVYDYHKIQDRFFRTNSDPMMSAFSWFQGKNEQTNLLTVGKKNEEINKQLKRYLPIFLIFIFASIGISSLESSSSSSSSQKTFATATGVDACLTTDSVFSSTCFGFYNLLYIINKLSWHVARFLFLLLFLLLLLL